MKEETVYLKDTALARRYGVSRPTIWRWLKKGALPKPIKLPGGSTRWRMVDLYEWEQSQIQANSESLSR